MKRYMYTLLIICLYMLPAGGCANQEGRLETEQYLARLDETIADMSKKPAPARKVEQAPVTSVPAATPAKVATTAEKPAAAPAKAGQAPMTPAPAAAPAKVAATVEKPAAAPSGTEQAPVVAAPTPAPVKVAAMAEKPVTATAKEASVTPASPVATPPGKVINAIAAVVNDDIITLYEVNREAKPAISDAEKKSALDDAARSRIRRMVLEGLVEKKLADQKIKELNITVSDDDVRQAIEDVKKQNNMTQEALVTALAAQGLSFDQYQDQLREQLEKLKLVSMEVRSKIQVGETEMRDYYEAHRAKYSEDDAFHARHIFFRVTEKSTPAEIKKAMKTALTVLDEAKSGKDFIELAKTYSEDPAARADGGDMGRFKKGDMMPELERAITALKPGEISELVSTPLGIHIIKLEERIPGKLKPFESVKAEIENEIYRKKSEERFSQWAKELRSKSSIEIKELKGLL